MSRTTDVQVAYTRGYVDGRNGQVSAVTRRTRDLEPGRTVQVKDVDALHWPHATIQAVRRHAQQVVDDDGVGEYLTLMARFTLANLPEPTLADDIQVWARQCGVDLEPWQIDMLHRIMATRVQEAEE